jgi:glycosyltransferase involved in cell wall biosynthesis
VKIVQVLYSGLGGHAGVAFGLAAGAPQKSWTMALAFVGIEALSPAYAIAARDADLAHTYVPSHAGRPWRNWPRLYAALWRESPDAIILHSVTSLPPCAAYARLHRRPLVVVEHTPNHLKTRAERRLSQLAMVIADRVVVLTDEYKHELAELCGTRYDARKTTVISNGIDTDLFAPAPRLERANAVRVGMAARFSGQKRQEVLVHVLAELIDRPARVPWHLSLAGAGERLDGVRREIDRLELGERVELCGMLDERQLAAWFRSLDIYAHASDGETLSLSLLQAMACEVPLVASDVPGISNLLRGRHGPLGILAPTDVKAFADGIERLHAGGTEMAVLVARAREVVQTRYSQQAMFQSYARIIQECLP